VFIITGFEKGKENKNYISIPYLFIYKMEIAKREQPKQIMKVKMNDINFESRFYYP